jgi:hypothetical protein
MSELLLPASGERVINADGRDVTAEVYGPIRKAFGALTPTDLQSPDSIKKAGEVITTATGLVAINLEAPSKNLYPVLTPIRNMLPRKGGGTGTQAQWRAVTAINGPSTMPGSPWLREGGRGALMSLTEADKSTPYVTIGLDTSVTFEAQSAAQGFEDVYSTAGMRLLQQTMIMEELAILGGNRSVALGVTATPTLSASGTGTLPNATYSVRVFALTQEGLVNAGGVAAITGIVRQVTLTGADAQTYVVNGGSSGAGAAATQATTGVQNLNCSVTAVRGAVAYAWYVGTAGNERLERITTINSAVFSAPLTGTGQLLSAVASAGTDYSFNNGTGGNNAPAFDGLLYNVFNSANGAIFTSLATGTAGTGTVLTASGRGTITEIDTILRSLWDTWRITPDVIYVNAQEMVNIATKIFGGTANGIARAMFPVIGNDGILNTGISGINYLNVLGTAANGNPVIPIRVHPVLAPGTILFWSQNLPAQYQSANVPQVASIDARRDYYQIPWPQVTRRQETGVYAEVALKCYAPFALAVLTNIANG